MRADDRRVTTPEKFWELVQQTGGCWEWQGGLTDRGYGVVGFGCRRRRAHTVAWELTHGPIPAGLVVCHTCDIRSCCNPAHLFLGTQLENIADRDAKGRGARPPSRAKLTDTQVRAVRDEYARGLATQQALAERYGISRGALSKVLTRRTYANVR